MSPHVELDHHVLRLRRRLQRQRRAVDALWALTSALGGAVIAAGALASSGYEPWPNALFGAALPTIASIAIRVQRHRRDPWDALASARLADTRMGWQERLSTALEHGHRDEAMVRALVLDAHDHAAELDLVRIAPWRWPRAALTALGIASIAMLLTLAWPTVHLTSETSDTVARDSAATAPSSTAVRSLADQVAADARRGRDVYLADLAEALRDLANGDATDRLDAERVAELDALLERIAAGFGDGVSADDLRERMAQTDAALRDADARSSAEAGDRTAAAERSGPDRMEVSGADTMPDFGAVFTETQESTARNDATGGSSGPASDVQLGAIDPSEVGDTDEIGSIDAPGLAGGPGEAIGASEDAGAGASQFAGRGVQELAGADTGVDLSGSDTDAVAIGSIERDEGRRIEIELPPVTEWEGYDPRLFSVGAWRAGPEAALPTDAVPLHYRSAAGQYFLPSQATATTP